MVHSIRIISRYAGTRSLKPLALGKVKKVRISAEGILQKQVVVDVKEAGQYNMVQAVVVFSDRNGRKWSRTFHMTEGEYAALSEAAA